MVLTSNYGLKKPEGTDPVDVRDFNDNADKIDAELKKRPESDGDASNMTVGFTESAQLTELTSNDTLKSLFGKLKLAVKNLISLIKLIGSTDISAYGDGTVTGALKTVNTDLNKKFAKTGTLRIGTATIESGTSLITVFETTCQKDATYIVTSHLKFSCKGCDVAVALTVNNNTIYQRSFRGTSNFNPFDTIEKFVDLKNGDIVAIKACQNSGANATVEYDYNYKE